jgi:hypothetical protein
MQALAQHLLLPTWLAWLLLLLLALLLWPKTLSKA